MKLHKVMLTSLCLILLGVGDFALPHRVSRTFGYSAMRCARYAPDGKTFLVCRDDGDVNIRNAETGELIQIIQSDSPITGAAYAPDSKTVVQRPGSP